MIEKIISELSSKETFAIIDFYKSLTRNHLRQVKINMSKCKNLDEVVILLNSTFETLSKCLKDGTMLEVWSREYIRDVREFVTVPSFGECGAPSGVGDVVTWDDDYYVVVKENRYVKIRREYF